MTAAAGAATRGLFSLTRAELALLDELDGCIAAWALDRGALVERNPELLLRSQLESIGYFDSFPHLAHEVRQLEAHDDGQEPCFLTSAACYGVYFARAGTVLDGPQLVTVRATCRRREDAYDRLRRQREFQMREVVALGPAEHVATTLEAGAAFMRELAGAYGVDARFEVGTDPFFRKDDPRAAFQRVVPTKRELIDLSGLAIGSLNQHRSFFADACGLSCGEEPLASGCVAFGLERWIDAILRIGSCATSC